MDVAAGLTAFFSFNSPLPCLDYLCDTAALDSAIDDKKRIIVFPYLGHYLILFLISLPPIIYTIYLTLTDFIAYNRYYSVGGPPTVFWLTILSYGFLFFIGYLILS